MADVKTKPAGDEPERGFGKLHRRAVPVVQGKNCLQIQYNSIYGMRFDSVKVSNLEINFESSKQIRQEG